MRVPRWSAVLVLALFSIAFAQDAPPDKPKPATSEDDRPVSRPGGPPPNSPSSPPTGDARQKTWLAPTAEDWKKPCLITWQRTWEDALAVSKETGKPILICVNMDGEVASEHYAGVRYRQPEVAKLYEPYVCVIASVYRHNPRDYDDQGRRILCPRFGCVTCGEHVALEPIVYEKYLDGQRIAPRHIMVELDGKERFDYFFANNVESVLDEIQRAIVERKGAPPPAVVRGDRPVEERVGSKDVGDRTAVESAYEKGDEAARKSLLDAALAKGADAPLDLLRLAVYGLDADAAKKARDALAKAESPAATDLISEALRAPMEDPQREALVAALERIGAKYPRAQWLAQVHRGLATKSGSVDVAAWTKALEGDKQTAVAAADWYAVETNRHSADQARRAKTDDPEAWLDFAEASVSVGQKIAREQSEDPRMAKMFARLAFEDARNAVEEAKKLKSTSWRADAVLALAAYYSGDNETAYPLAESAMNAMPKGEPGPTATCILSIFAEQRFKTIRDAVRDKKQWPSHYVADVNAAYSVLLQSPRATDAQAAWHYDFLEWLGAVDRAGKALDVGLARFPGSESLHERLRTRTLKMKGTEALEAAYDALLSAKDASPVLERYAGQASMTAADFYRRARRADPAMAAYDRAIAHYEKAAANDPEFRDMADHFEALAHAGRARVAFESDDDERATAEILASLDKRLASAGLLDGVGVSPAQTANDLLTRLKDRKKDDLATKLDAAMSKLPPDVRTPSELNEGK